MIPAIIAKLLNIFLLLSIIIFLLSDLVVLNRLEKPAKPAQY
jgi:hypothetical protein